MVTRAPIKHGTYGGAQAHRRRKETVCTKCLNAEAAYMKKYRANPSNRRRDYESIKAGDLARRELARLHKAEYAALKTKHLARLRGVELR